MIGNRRVLGVITARGGSKGLPGKNIRLIAGKPLLVWSIEQADRSRYLDRLVISTDDEEIADVARKYGCEVPFMRPDHLAEDKSGTVEVISHLLSRIAGFDILVVLQPTSPLRLVEDIDGAIDLFARLDAYSCISVVNNSKCAYWSYQVDEQHRLQPSFGSVLAQQNRQSLPESYMPNGALYVIDTQRFPQFLSMVNDDSVAYVMPEERSVDIDTEMDFRLAEFYLKARCS